MNSKFSQTEDCTFQCLHHPRNMLQCIKKRRDTPWKIFLLLTALIWTITSISYRILSVLASRPCSVGNPPTICFILQGSARLELTNYDHQICTRILNEDDLAYIAPSIPYTITALSESVKFLYINLHLRIPTKLPSPANPI